MRFTKDITIGEIPTASNSNYSALFQADGQVRKRTLGSIITQDIDAYLSGISVAFPTSIFNIADSSITPSQPNLVVSLKNQLAGTVFAAPETLNGTPSFRKLSDVDLSETTVAFQEDITDNYLRLGNHTVSQGGFSAGGDVFSLRNTVAWATSGSNRPNNTNSAIVAFTPYKSGTSEYGFFLGARNNRLWLSTLENSTPSSWVEIAKRSEFDNYLPLSGGTMVDNSTINWVTTGQLAVAGNSRLRFTGTQTVLSGLVSSGQGIYFRPQGDTVTASQVSIQYDGQINTTNHGNSSQWKEAYDAISTIPNAPNNGLLTISTSSDLTGGGTFSADQATASNVDIALSSSTLSNIQLGVTAHGWGDFRDYGLGRVSWGNVTSFEDIDANTGTQLRSVGGELFGITSTHRPIGFIAKGVISTRWSWMGVTDQGPIRIYATNSTAVDNYVELYHSDNFNPSGYVPTARTITAGNGLSGGGNLTANRTITLGTPTAITLSSTNSVTTSSHTHAFTPGGTAAQYIRGDGSLATFVDTTYSAGTVALLTAGTNTTNRVWSARNLHDGIMHLINQNADSIFAYSPQGGLYTTDWSSTALGLHSVAIGYTSVVTASSSTSIGKGVFTGGAMSQNIGFSSNVNKALSANVGSYNLNNAELGNTFGQGLINQGMGLTVIGKYNLPFQHQPNMDEDVRTAAIQFGVGKDELTRRNAVTIFNDRRMDYDAQRDDSTWNQNTIPDIKWIQENISGGGGGGGNMNFAYIDHTNTHFFGNDEANGLLIPSSLISGSPSPDPTFSAIKVYTHDGAGGYSAPTVDTYCNPLAISVTSDILVRRGCIKLPSGIDVSTTLSDKNKLVLSYNKVTNTVSLSWESATSLFAIKHEPNYLGILIGDAFNDSTGDAYFNVNPQIL